MQGQPALGAHAQATDGVLQPTTAFQHTKVPQWTSNVIEGCIKRLKDLNKPCKYVVTSVVMQRNGAGLHMSTSCFWDNASDGSASYRWENKTMYCITTVFGLAI
jgi:dynein light chain Tctex-type 1